MRRIEEGIVINRPTEGVFAYLETRSHVSDWMVSVLVSHWLDPDEPDSPTPTVLAAGGGW